MVVGVSGDADKILPASGGWQWYGGAVGSGQSAPAGQDGGVATSGEYLMMAATQLGLMVLEVQLTL